MRTWVGLLLLAMLPAGVGAELPPARNGFVVIAHRGHHARAHENTLTALREAAEAGADYVEMDVRRTADGCMTARWTGQRTARVQSRPRPSRN